MRSFAAWTLGCFVLLTPAVHADQADTTVIDGLVKDAMQAWRVPGVAVAIVRDGKVIYLKGHGVRDLGTNDPMTPDTLFPIASCTKAFTTAALAILVDEGKLAWDDHVRKHIPFFHLTDPLADHDVRLRDLLCHRTGLRSHDLLWYHAPWSPEESVRRVTLLPLDKPFRTAFQYQSTMFTAIGIGVGRTAGMPWEDFVRTRLLQPLGMKTTFCTSTAVSKDTARATGYLLDERRIPVKMPAYPLAAPDAAGSIHSSARDLARWLCFHLDGGTVDGKRIVSSASLGETHRPQMVIPLVGTDRLTHPDTVQMSYGMGWVIQDYRGRCLNSHAGIIDGFRCHLTMLPDEKIGIVVLTNLHRSRLNLALSNTLVDLLLGLPAKDWNSILKAVVRQESTNDEEEMRSREAARKRGTRPSLAAAAYVGDYKNPAYGTARVALERGRLVWSFHGFSAPLEHYQNDTFTLPIGLIACPLVRFTLGAGGTIESLHVGGTMNVDFRRADEAAR